MNLFQELYLDYVNDFLTVAKFAAYHRLTVEQARYVIAEGKRFHESSLKGDK